MSGATSSTISNLVKPEVIEKVSTVVFRNSEFIPLFRFDYSPASVLGINVNIAGNSSVGSYVEGQADPDPGYQQVVQASVPWKYFKVMTRITGHAKDNLGLTWENVYSNSSSAPNAYGGQFLEPELAAQDLVDYMNTYFMAAQTYGIQGIVDDDTTAFYNLSRSTYTALKSYVKSSAGALSLSLMDRLLQNVREQGGRVEAILISPTQGRKYDGLVEGKIALPSAGDAAGGAGAGFHQPHNRVPVIEARDLTETTMIALSGLSGSDDSSSWRFVSHCPHPSRVEWQAVSFGNDAATAQLTTSGALVCPIPAFQGKLEGLGTT